MNKNVGIATLLACVAATPVAAAPVVWAGNGHAYEYIGQGLNWDAARAAALSMSFNGQQGYLVTITSAAEQAFITSSVTTITAWAGGTDSAVEGTWVWADGPEANEVFWIGGPGGSSPTYANWNPGEPNNLGDEDYLHINAGQGNWNDIPERFNYGYIVEYGGLNVGVPEPSAWALFILGFGAVGGALRRSRKVRSALTYA